MGKVIIVEGDAEQRQRWASALEARGIPVEERETLPPDLGRDPALVIVLGPGAGGADPGALLRRLGESERGPATLCLVPPGNVEAAVEAMRDGASEVLEADIGVGRLSRAVERLSDRAERLSLAREAEDLRARYAELESLVYLISHDLKTPLVSIQGISTILLEGAAEEERGREYVRRIQANAERIEDLVRDLLEFPRVGRLVGVMERVDMGEVVDRALDSLAERIEETGARIEVEEDLPQATGDRKRLQQVFQNLLDNAIKYGEREGPARVRVGCSRGEEEDTFFVRDEGVGISEEGLERAFHLFRRLERNGERKHDGMGIGLAVTRRIVEGHGGRIWAESTVGEGSTFFFTLPAREEDPLAAAKEGGWATESRFGGSRG